MTEITLTPDGKRVALLLRQDGVIAEQYRFDPLSPNQQKATATKCGVPIRELLFWIEKMRDQGYHTTKLGEPVPPEKLSFTIRELEKREGEEREGSPEEILLALPSIPLSHVLVWHSKEDLCCLDVDYHESLAPSSTLLQAVVETRLAPLPRCWHQSRGGGLHLFYTASFPFTAEELASVAALRYRMIDPLAGVELKSVVRGPGEAQVHSVVLDSTPGGLMLDWLKDPARETQELEEWLEEHHLELGHRYPHERCPVSPSPDEGKHREPLVLKEGGITCYLCEARGTCFGSRRPGYFPWSALLSHPSSGPVGLMVRCLCPWGHAKWIFKERYKLPEALSKLAYSAALKAYHGGTREEALVPGVFAHETSRYTRIDDDWTNVEDLKVYSNRVAPTIAKMPRAQTVDEKGVPRVNPSQVTNFMENISLESEGFPPIRLIFGAPMLREPMPKRETLLPVSSPALREAGGEGVLPRYVPFTKRMKLDKALKVLERVIPGTNWDLLNLLLCGIGSTQETEMGSPPRIFVAGPSGSAKTSHFKIAAGIAGVGITQPTMQSSDERLMQAIKQGIKKGPLLVINELFKDTVRKNKRFSAAQALEPILNMEPDAVSHTMYKGPEKMGRQFVLGLTEITLPPDIKDETQIARRLRYVRLTSSHPEWQQLMAEAGLKDFTDLRLGGQEFVEACNSVLSECMDRYFVVPRSFDALADELKFPTLDRSTEFENHDPLLRSFFQLVCGAPEINNPALTRLYGSRGFKQISRTDDSFAQETSGPDPYKDLFVIYSCFADGPGAEWTGARKLEEKDWGRILGTPEPVKFDMRVNGSSVLVRFITGPTAKPEMINEQIVDPTTWREQ